MLFCTFSPQESTKELSANAHNWEKHKDFFSLKSRTRSHHTINKEYAHSNNSIFSNYKGSESLKINPDFPQLFSEAEFFKQH